MIWKLRVTCVAGPHYDEPCVRFIEIGERANLYDLHVAIQDAVEFDDQLDFVFFTAKSHRSKRSYFPEGVDPDDGVDVDIYEDLLLAEALKLCDSKQSLYYLYSLDEEWIFEVVREPGEKEADPDELYPLVLDEDSVGPDPLQYGADMDDYADPDEALEYESGRQNDLDDARYYRDDDDEDDDDDDIRRSGDFDDEEDDPYAFFDLLDGDEDGEYPDSNW